MCYDDDDSYSSFTWRAYSDMLAHLSLLLHNFFFQIQSPSIVRQRENNVKATFSFYIVGGSVECVLGLSGEIFSPGFLVGKLVISTKHNDFKCGSPL